MVQISHILSSTAAVWRRDLASNGFSGTIPTQLGRLTNLTRLYVYATRAESIFDEQFNDARSVVHLNALSGPIPSFGNITSWCVIFSNVVF